MTSWKLILRQRKRKPKRRQKSTVVIDFYETSDFVCFHWQLLRQISDVSSLCLLHPVHHITSLNIPSLAMLWKDHKCCFLKPNLKQNSFISQKIILCLFLSPDKFSASTMTKQILHVELSLKQLSCNFEDINSKVLWLIYISLTEL